MKSASLTLLLSLLAVLAVGCSHNMEKVMLPPEAPMDSVKTIAVVGVSNFTVDPGLGLLFEQIVTTTLRDSGRYQVIDTAAAKAALAKMGASLDQLPDPETAKKLGSALGVDALITGSANYYFDETKISTPECNHCQNDQKTPYWYVRQTTNVLTTFQARVIRTDTGVIIWSNVPDGRDSTQRTKYLDWNQPTPPPSTLVPQTDRSDIPTTREAAVREAAREFTKDLLPRYIWVRKEGNTGG